MRRWIVYALGLVSLCNAAVAQAEPPALIVTKAGFYYVVLDSAGEPQLVRVTKVISIGDGGPDIPIPPDTPTPVPNPVREQVKAWAEEVNHPIGAQALELVYTTVADQVRSGSVPPDKAFEAVKQATDAVLNAPGVNGREKWAGWRANVGTIITPKVQAGELSTGPQIEAFLRDVAAGLKASAAAAPALTPEQWKVIFDIILALLTRLFGGGGPV